MPPVLLLLLLLSSMTASTAFAADEANGLDGSPAVCDVLENVNKGLRNLIHGDIAPSSKRNAAPCTSTGCKWPKLGRYVRVPVIISSRYTENQRNIIIRSLVTFHRTTCIRFVWKHPHHKNYLYFFSGRGCWSYVGRQSTGQRVSLQRNGCLSQGTVQHEVLHALGFHHEHVRSDRDRYVRILTQNIISGMGRNFQKVWTNNLQTPYDFNSVMHYSRYAFSKSNKPTIISRSNPNISFGGASTMSSNDVARVNRLYRCRG